MSFEKFNPFSKNKSEAEKKKAMKNAAIAVAAGLGAAVVAQEGVENYKESKSYDASHASRINDQSGEGSADSALVPNMRKQQGSEYELEQKEASNTRAIGPTQRSVPEVVAETQIGPSPIPEAEVSTRTIGPSERPDTGVEIGIRPADKPAKRTDIKIGPSIKSTNSEKEVDVTEPEGNVIILKGGDKIPPGYVPASSQHH